MRHFRRTPLIALAMSISACATTGSGPASGALESRSASFDGAPFTAVWREGTEVLVTVNYDGTIPMTDERLAEIAGELTGCTAQPGASAQNVIGGMASVQVRARCGADAREGEAG